MPLDSNSNSNRNVQFRPASAINRAEEDVGDSSSGIILDGSDISNKRTANEIAVLDKILKLATMEDSGDDLKLKIVNIQLEAQKKNLSFGDGKQSWMGSCISLSAIVSKRSLFGANKVEGSN